MSQDFNSFDDEKDPPQEGGEGPSRNETGPTTGRSSSPEPPARWKPSTSSADNPANANREPGNTPQKPSTTTGMGVIGKTQFQLTGEEANMFMSARRFMLAAQLMAVVSLFIGGILLSSIALICAFFANGKLTALAARHPDDLDVQAAFKRAGKLIIIVAFIALVVNVAALIIFYPMIMNFVQSGDFGSLMGSAGTTAAGSGNATWG